MKAFFATDGSPIVPLPCAPSFPAVVLGEPSLGVERTWGSSLTLATSGHWLATETSIFVNYVDDYIYLLPEGISETIRGPMPVFRYRPVDAVFHGGEHLWVDAMTGKIARRVNFVGDVAVRARVNGQWLSDTRSTSVGKQLRAIIQQSNLLVAFERSLCHFCEKR